MQIRLISVDFKDKIFIQLFSMLVTFADVCLHVITVFSQVLAPEKNFIDKARKWGPSTPLPPMTLSTFKLGHVTKRTLAVLAHRNKKPGSVPACGKLAKWLNIQPSGTKRICLRTMELSKTETLQTRSFIWLRSLVESVWCSTEEMNLWFVTERLLILKDALKHRNVLQQPGI